MNRGIITRRLIATPIIVLLAFVGLAVAMSTSADASPAYPPPEACAISAPAGPLSAGQSLQITGSGFAADASVSLAIHSVTTPLGTARADGNGSFTEAVTIPAMVSGPDHSIVASSADMMCTADLTLGTHAQAVQRETSAEPSAPAETGFAALTAIFIAVALLGGGLVFVLIGRKRSDV